MPVPPVTMCSFCGKLNTDVGPMAEGWEAVYICGPCLQVSKQLIDGAPLGIDAAARPIRCSFCNKDVIGPRGCVEGPNDLYMCAGCVDLGLFVVAHNAP